MSWIIENMGTIVICLLLCAIVTAIIIRLIKNKKAGKSSCGCGCQNCAMSGACHAAGDQDMKKAEEEILRKIRENK